MKNGVRILTPSEYVELREGASDLDEKTQLDSLLLTGLRYVEAKRLQQNELWFESKRKSIALPAYAQKKAKRKQRERWVKLSDKGHTLLPFFFKVKPLPDWWAWSTDMRRWARTASLDPEGLGPKTTRKSWESWLIASYPERAIEVFLSQGHVMMTSLESYLTVPFTQTDKEAMKEWVAGW